MRTLNQTSALQSGAACLANLSPCLPAFMQSGAVPMETGASVFPIHPAHVASKHSCQGFLWHCACACACVCLNFQCISMNWHEIYEFPPQCLESTLPTLLRVRDSPTPEHCPLSTNQTSAHKDISYLASATRPGQTL